MCLRRYNVLLCAILGRFSSYAGGVAYPHCPRRTSISELAIFKIKSSLLGFSGLPTPTAELPISTSPETSRLLDRLMANRLDLDTRSRPINMATHGLFRRGLNRLRLF